MRAWQVHELGDPQEVLKLEEVEEPEPGRGEVVVEVEAAALNFFDILLCKGEYQERPDLPFTPGAEVSGPIVEAGEGVDLAVGTRVLATPPLPKGGYAEKVAAPADGSVFYIPDGSLRSPPAGGSSGRRDRPRARGCRRRRLGGHTGSEGGGCSCYRHGRRPRKGRSLREARGRGGRELQGGELRRRRQGGDRRAGGGCNLRPCRRRSL